MQIDAKTVKDRLISNLEHVLTHLFPNGKVVGHEFRVGSVNGEAGKGGRGGSLGVQLQGKNRGVWQDYAFGNNPDNKGDIIKLWCQARNQTFREAFPEMKRFVGFTSAEPIQRKPKPEVPTNGITRLTPEVHQYLAGRGLGDPALKRYRVRSHARPSAFNQHFMLFPFIDTEGTPVMIKSTGIMKKEGGQKDIWTSEPYYTLWGWWLVDDDCREIVITEGECYDDQTEVLTRNGWVCFPELIAGEEVMQVEADGSGLFVRPLARISKPYSGSLIQWESSQVDLVVTPGHKMVVFEPNDGREKLLSAKDVTRQYGIYKTCRVSGPRIALSDDQIRFALAISADAKIDIRKNTGYHKAPTDRYFHFGFIKQRKVDRLLRLCRLVGVEPTVNRASSDGNAYTYISGSLPEWVPGRFLPLEWIALATGEQRTLLLDELIEWDGNRVPNRKQTEYSSKWIQNAEWVQSLAVTSGIASTIIKRENRFGKWFKVSILHGKSTASIQPKQRSFVPYSGYVHCVTVPSGRLLVRRNQKVSVCGNCDAMSLYQIGCPYPVLSLPSGVSNMDWIENDWDRLQMLERIWVASDMDKPHPKTGLLAGEEGAKEIAKRLGPARVKRIPIPGEFKDINDLLLSGDESFFDWVYSWESHAYSFDPPTIAGVESFRNEAQARLARQKRMKAENNFIWPKIPFQYRNGEMTVISGYPHSGKSAVSYQTHAHEMWIGEKVFICSFEIEPEAMLVELSHNLTGVEPTSEKLDEVLDWLTGKLYFFRRKKRERTNLPELLADLDYCVQRFGCTRIIVDSLHFLARKEDYEGQDNVSLQLTNFAKSRDVHVALVCHSVVKKGEEIVPGMGMVEGSGGITKPIDNGFSVWRNIAKEEAILKARDSKDDAKLAKAFAMHDGVIKFWKNRESGKLPFIRLWFSPDGKSYRLSPDDPVYAPLGDEQPKVADPNEELF